MKNKIINQLQLVERLLSKLQGDKYLINGLKDTLIKIEDEILWLE